MTRDVPDQILAVVELTDVVTVEHVPTGGVQNIHAFRPSRIVVVKGVDRHLMRISVCQIHVHRERGG